MEMIGLKNCLDPIDSNSTTRSMQRQHSTSSTSSNVLLNEETATASGITLEQLINQNSMTYEQLQMVIEDLLNENNYHVEIQKHLREELPSID